MNNQELIYKLDHLQSQLSYRFGGAASIPDELWDTIIRLKKELNRQDRALAEAQAITLLTLNGAL